MLMCGGAYRQAMVGTIALYDEAGERQHTMYIAAAPEYGKETFKARLTREIERASALYPSAIKIGVADGAHDNWPGGDRWLPTESSHRSVRAHINAYGSSI